jgi:hypothetical protein
LSTDQKPRDRAHLITMRYAFPKGAKDSEGNTLASMDLREVDTRDLEEAAKQADAKGTHGLYEQVAMAIVRVNGQPLVTGSIEGWNQIAADFALLAYRRLNSFPADLAEELLSKGEVVPA